MLLRTTPPQVHDDSRRRPAGRASPARRVRAVAAPPQLDATTGAARFGPGGTVHIDDGIIARYASFVDRARPAPSPSHTVTASPLPAGPTPRPSPTPSTPPPPTTTPAPRAPAAIGVRRGGVDRKASLAPGTPEARRLPASPSPPSSPPLLAPPRRHIVGRSPIDDDDAENENDDGDDDEGDLVYAAGPEEPADRVAACALALVAALVVGHWRRARP
ncbi:hypothetical protein pqer_cds_496 [Pandoravirus quercus]|uniref:Uncharacterized protein n=2 Tax=Pandoravirus TaxID=2060084 RepID=A0A2U7U8Y9_9VIRU|nr:hypothetical protein pqer_cds_496 [Pandoravirus quercus]AVK74918.1 hypothetical protein pqer_cds_496 [Pandoravirus quercus]QBZ81105.1 hypothetical protein pclt_cds_511 [Pandoravirus celtis]